MPRYLPRYGMAPEWTRATRPLVLIYTAIGFALTLLFRADVDAQGGAYATGVLVLMTSAAVAVTLSVWRDARPAKGVCFALVTLVFVYTTLVNVIERPDGLKIGAFFIAAIVLSSLVSRVWRTTELRVEKITLDSEAQRFINEMDAQGELRIVANQPRRCDDAEYSRREQDQRVHVLAFFLLLYGARLLKKLVDMIPGVSEKQNVVEIASEIEQTAARYFTSVTLINAVLGLSVWIFVGFLGLPHPLLWGVAAFLLHYIPFVGATGGIVAMTLVSLIHFDSAWYALLPPLAYLLCAMIEGNLATPLFLGRWLVLNPIAILLTFLLWSYLWGVAGICWLFPSLQPSKYSAIVLNP